MIFLNPIVISKKIHNGNSLLKTKSFAASFGVHAALLASVTYFMASHPLPLPQSEESVVISLAEFTSTSGDIHRLEQPQPKEVRRPTPEYQPETVHRIEPAPAQTTSQEIPSSKPAVSPEASAPLALPAAAHTEPPKTANDSPHLTPPSATEHPKKVPDTDNDIGGAALGHIRAMIEKAITYPAIARKLRLEGTVTVTFTLQSDGTVETAQVKRTSGSNLLDAKAVQTILSLSGDYPALGKTVELSIPIAFNLHQS